MFFLIENITEKKTVVLLFWYLKGKTFEKQNNQNGGVIHWERRRRKRDRWISNLLMAMSCGDDRPWPSHSSQSQMSALHPTYKPLGNGLSRGWVDPVTIQSENNPRTSHTGNIKKTNVAMVTQLEFTELGIRMVLKDWELHQFIRKNIYTLYFA